MEKPKRIVDFELLASVKRQSCDACGRRPADPAHIYARGAGGPDTAWNVIPLCRLCHIKQHTKGWVSFVEARFALKIKLQQMGWLTPPQSPTGRLWHPSLASNE